MAIALVIAILVGADIGPVLGVLADRTVSPPFAAVAFLGAGYLAGRAMATRSRARRAIPLDMR